jgi:methylated-DNA-protein-cysteine methyltransferase related protein
MDEATVMTVYDIIDAIPPGSVMTYGDIAEAAGLPSPRMVGTILSRGAEPVPWHRVVRADGTCAPHLQDEQLSRLRAEGVPLRGMRVILAQARLDPGEVHVEPH